MFASPFETPFNTPLTGSFGADDESVIPTLWTPANTTTSLWLDATDASTITHASNVVSEWRDKSGNNRTYTQPTTTAQPLTNTTTVNGLNAILFDSSNDGMFTTSRPLPDKNGGIFIVYRSTSVGLRILSGSNGAPGVDSTFNALVAARAEVGGNHAIFTGVFTNSNVPFTLNTPVIASLSMTATANASSYYLNGALVSNTVNMLHEFGFLALGASGEYAEAGNGAICEVIATATTPTVETVQLMEGYLAWKWGLQGSLPASHPYKAAAPTA